eukprot:5371897-Prymnesium_polylepis.1
MGAESAGRSAASVVAQVRRTPSNSPSSHTWRLHAASFGARVAKVACEMTTTTRYVLNAAGRPGWNGRRSATYATAHQAATTPTAVASNGTAAQ